MKARKTDEQKLADTEKLAANALRELARTGRDYAEWFTRHVEELTPQAVEEALRV